MLPGWKKPVVMGRACYFWAKYRRTAGFLKLHIFLVCVERKHFKGKHRDGAWKILNGMFGPRNLEPFAFSNLFSSSTYALIRGDLFEVTLGTSIFGVYGLETLQRCYGVNALPQSIPNPRPKNRDNSTTILWLCYWVPSKCEASLAVSAQQEHPLVGVAKQSQSLPHSI